MRVYIWVDSVQVDDSFEFDSDAVPRKGEIIEIGDYNYEVASVRYKVRKDELWASVCTHIMDWS